ncbi:5024_t:CDS:2, partial [Ambispora leptoticha]
EGYESDSSDKSISTPPPPPNLNNNNHLQKLTAENDNLKEQKKEPINKELEQALQEANRKIREQSKIIEELKIKESPLKATHDQATQTKPQKYYFFTCDICEQNKKSKLHRERVNGLGIDPTKINKICSSHYEPEEGVFYGKFFGQATTDIIRNSQQQEIIIFVHKTLKDKNLFKQESKVEHSKENQKIKATPQSTDFINIPYTQGEDMVSDTYGRAQLLKQQKKELKTIEREITKGRRISNEDGSIQYKDTYDKTES